MKRALVALLAVVLAVAVAAVAVAAGVGDRTLKRLLPEERARTVVATEPAAKLPRRRTERQLATLRGPRPKPSGLPRVEDAAQPTVFLSPAGDDGADCTRESPCLTLAAPTCAPSPGRRSSSPPGATASR